MKKTILTKGLNVRICYGPFATFCQRFFIRSGVG